MKFIAVQSDSYLETAHDVEAGHRVAAINCVAGVGYVVKAEEDVDIAVEGVFGPEIEQGIILPLHLL